MDTVESILQKTIEGYTGKGLNGYAYLVHDPDRAVFTVISVGFIKGKRYVDANLIVRLVENKIIIERDQNDKVLVEALIQVGVPRDQIILPYAGEPVPEVA